MNVFIREINASRKALIIWSIIMVILVISGMGKYASLSTSGQSLNELLAQMPSSLKVIIGMGTFDLTKAIGYYGVLFLYLVLMATVQATMLGVNIISKEERDKTAEFLFVKPISRNKIITAKIWASLVNVLVINLVTYISSIIMVQKYSNGEEVIAKITILMIGMLILQLIFLFTGTAIGSISKRPNSAPSLAIGILLFTFMLSLAIDLDSRLEILGYFTPFKYYEAKKMLSVQGFELVYVILSGIIIVALFWVTYVFYKKRDLNI